MSKLSTIFKEVREDNDATQSDVAKSVNITLGQLKQYEAGTVMPSLITARKLCEFYDLSWKKLGQIIQDNLKDNENKKPQLFKNKINRSVVRTRGLHIVMERLLKNGWEITETNTEGRKNKNYDMCATKNQHSIRLKITTKHHPTKAILSVAWNPNESTFNKNPGTKADFLVMVRYTSATDSECFLMSISEAEKKANWFADQLRKLGSVPLYFQPYTSKKHTTHFKFNTRKVWERYLENWQILS